MIDSAKAAEKATDRSSIRIENDRGEVARLTEWLLELCKSWRLADKVAFAIQLCVEETVANIMMHGKGDGRASEIVVSLDQRPGEVSLTIEDNGAPFDPTAFEVRQPGQNLDETSVGGLGIKLMRQFADRIDYHRDHGRNQLRLTFANAAAV
jgi:anti-sigma regulatory factor (Ser/Thr protein kinase)